MLHGMYERFHDYRKYISELKHKYHKKNPQPPKAETQTVPSTKASGSQLIRTTEERSEYLTESEQREGQRQSADI